ncbi:ParA family chromosome partitioning ATPase [Gloeomargarita lithophora Alchichica-D10]|uniref:ParA family chromosome partitioning ATPase n=2 Tax=Gloeomargarita TaxID=1188227 RepID=A0A1J0ADP7_9CYAN|nr:ParA family chromosome partitioning ATPase [Gloeomargarita lithophora Alchichica-D10]
MFLAIANHKGGVGKTTSTLALGGLLSELGSCLVVDLDPQGNLTTGLGVELGSDQPGAYHWLTGQVTAAQVIQKTASGLYLLPADGNLSRAEMELLQKSGAFYTLRDRLTSCREQFRYVLMDCPPSRGLLTINALAAADWVLIPVQCQFFALKGLSALLETVDHVQRRLNPKLQILGVLPTMAEMQTIMTQDVLNALTAQQNFPIFKPLPKSVKFPESNLAGEPIHRYTHDARLLTPLRELVQFIQRQETL